MSTSLTLARRELTYRETLDGASFVIRETSGADVRDAIARRAPRWGILAVATALFGYGLYMTPGGDSLAWIRAVGASAIIPGAIAIVFVKGRLDQAVEAMGTAVSEGSADRFGAWLVALGAVLVLYGWAEGAHVGKVLVGATGGALAWQLVHDGLRALHRASRTAVLSATPRELEVRNQLFGLTVRTDRFPLAELEPDVVSTTLGQTLQLGPRAYLFARGTSPTALRFAVSRLRELVFRASKSESGARPPDEIQALVEADLQSPREIELPLVWLPTTILGVAVGAGVAAAAYPFCALFGWSIHSIGAIAIVGIGLGLSPMVRHALGNRS